MERSLSTRNLARYEGREAAHCRESSVKKRHVIHRVMRMTPEMTHRGSVSREGSTTICSTAPQLMASKSDFHLLRT